jgi:hypothetical protein
MKYISWTKGGNIYETYWFIWIGKLCININRRKRISIFKKINQYFARNRNLIINI